MNKQTFCSSWEPTVELCNDILTSAVKCKQSATTTSIKIAFWWSWKSQRTPSSSASPESGIFNFPFNWKKIFRVTDCTETNVLEIYKNWIMFLNYTDHRLLFNPSITCSLLCQCILTTTVHCQKSSTFGRYEPLSLYFPALLIIQVLLHSFFLLCSFLCITPCYARNW